MNRTHRHRSLSQGDAPRIQRPLRPISAPVVRPRSPYPDVLLISLREDHAAEAGNLLEHAHHVGLRTESLVLDSRSGARVRESLCRLHHEDKLGPGTQVFLNMHGVITDGRHMLSSHDTTLSDTATFIQLLRNPYDDGRCPKWKGVLHLFTCYAAIVREPLKDLLGYTIVHGGHKVLLTEERIQTQRDLLALLARNRDTHGNLMPAAEIFRHASALCLEPSALLGNGQKIVHNPFRLLRAEGFAQPQTPERWTRLLFARALHGHSDDVRRVLAAAPRDAEGMPAVADQMWAHLKALHLAAISHIEALEKIRLLLAARQPVDVRDLHGRTPLMHAVADGLPRAIEFLIEQGANLELQSASGKRALDYAVRLGRIDALRCLLAAGARAGAAPSPASSPLCSPLMQACLLGNSDIAGLLLDHAPPNVAETTHNGKTLLHVACISLSRSVVRRLVDCGANPLQEAQDGSTALEAALERGNPGIVNALLWSFSDEVPSADVDALMRLCEYEGAPMAVLRFRIALTDPRWAPGELDAALRAAVVQ